MNTYKPLGQSAPSATTNTDVYTVPASRSAIVQIVVANRANTDTTFRIALRTLGAAIANAHYLAYDVAIRANQTLVVATGLALQATDVITAYAGTANLSVNVNGVEIS
jgi:hypothetical protein